MAILLDVVILVAVTVTAIAQTYIVLHGSAKNMASRARSNAYRQSAGYGYQPETAANPSNPPQGGTGESDVRP